MLRPVTPYSILWGAVFMFASQLAALAGLSSAGVHLRIRRLTAGFRAARRRNRQFPLIAIGHLEDRALLTAPIANDDSFMTPHDQTLTAFAPGVLMNDSDMDGDPITPTLLTSTSNGTLTFSANGAFTYVPNTRFVGTDSFTYKVSDGTADSSAATVSISVFNAAPSATNDAFMTRHDQTLTVPTPGVLMNDSEMNGDPITPTLLTTTSNGTLTFNANGSFTYTPNTVYVGSDSFTYKVSDGLSDSNTVTVTIDVTNSPPSAADDVFVYPEPGVEDVDIDVLQNDWDMDDDH